MTSEVYMIMLDSGCPSGDGYSCNVFIARYKLDKNIDKAVLLNALVPSTTPTIMITMLMSIEEAKELVRKAQSVESYIGHEATARLLSQVFEREIPVNRAMYMPRNKDIAIVVRLKKRLEKPDDIKNITENDVEFLLVRYYNADVVTYP
jgi:hypothetical protein